jgi:hypothetical protein
MPHYSHTVHVNAALRKAEYLVEPEIEDCFFRKFSGARRNSEGPR